MKTAVCPGSFDPVTVGHLDIIQRAASLFDKVIVLVGVNAQKTPSFTPEERVDFLRRVTGGLDNVEVEICEGLIVDHAKRVGANAIVKGLRAMTDFEYEFQMALINRTLNDGIETVFLTTSAVKQVAYYGGDISPFIPPQILSDIEKRLRSQH